MTTIEKGFELLGTAAVGLTAAAIAGESTLLWGAMSAVAYLVSQVAGPVFERAPTFEEHGMWGGSATLAVEVSWVASITQLIQYGLRCVGRSTQFAPSFGIVLSAILLGSRVGRAVHHAQYD